MRKSELRRKAEEELDAWIESKDLPERAGELLHELRVHQIELEMQNEELRLAQAALELSRSKYADLYDFAPVGYLTLDPRGMVLEANLTACRDLQVERRTFEGRTLVVSIRQEDRQGFFKHLQDVFASGERQAMQLGLVRKNTGDILEARLDTMATVDGSGQKVCRTSVTDITEQKRAADEVRQVNRKLKEYASRLEAANQELRSYSYSVAHDLRAPLRGIDGFAKALDEDYRGRLDDTARDYINRLRAAAQRMDRMVNALLHLSQITQGELTRLRVDLTRVALAVIRELQDAEPNREARVEIAQNITALGDLETLRILVDNLIRNAWKFTSGTDGAVIEFGACEMSGEQVYFVRDNGAGFNPEYAGRLFLPFQRLHMSGEFPGMGVGLATVKRIVEKHGGRVWAEGRPNEGAAFYFTLGAGTDEDSGSGLLDNRE